MTRSESSDDSIRVIRRPAEPTAAAAVPARCSHGRQVRDSDRAGRSSSGTYALWPAAAQVQYNCSAVANCLSAIQLQCGIEPAKTASVQHNYSAVAAPAPRQAIPCPVAAGTDPRPSPHPRGGVRSGPPRAAEGAPRPPACGPRLAYANRYGPGRAGPGLGCAAEAGHSPGRVVRPVLCVPCSNSLTRESGMYEPKKL